MPPAILDLPEEILDACLSEFLPPLGFEGAHLMDQLRSYPRPSDLSRCRLVCRGFNNIASPLAWRRVHLRAPQYSTRDTDICAHLSTHSTSASHIRSLSLSLQASLNTQPTLRTALRRMKNVQVAIVQDRRKHRGLPTEVVCWTRLHTLMLESEWNSLPLLTGPTEVNIQNFSYSGPGPIQGALQVMPRLQALSLCEITDEPDPVTLPIPWGTLRELELLDMERWELVLNNFERWKQTNTSLSSPLVELHVGRIDMQNDEVERLLKAFSLQPLSCLILSEVSEMDLDMLDRIVTSFPDVKKLFLHVDSGLDSWDLDGDLMVATLAKLKHIETFGWDHNDPDIFEENKYDRVEETVLSLSNTLTCLIYGFSADEYCAVFQIHRDDNNEYQGLDFRGLEESWRGPRTSAWSSQNRLLASV